MEYTYLALATLVLFFLLLSFALPAMLGRSGPLYTRRESLFTAAELHFLHALRDAAPDGLEVFAKVRVADVLQPVSTLDQKSWRRAFNRITGKHFDFVLCERASGRFRCVIELNDRSHERLERRKRDQLLSEACAGAKLPLLMIPVARLYDREELRSQIEVNLTARNQPDSSTAPIDSPHLCPRCGSLLVQKMARRGPGAGRAFLACSRFPNCRHTSEIQATDQH